MAEQLPPHHSRRHTSPLALEDPRVNRRALLPDFSDDFSDEEEFNPAAQGRIRKPSKEKAPKAPTDLSFGPDSTSTKVATGSKIVDPETVFYNKDYYDVMTENYVPPGQQRNLRACMVCSIVMTQSVTLTSYYAIFFTSISRHLY